MKSNDVDIASAIVANLVANNRIRAHFVLLAPRFRAKPVWLTGSSPAARARPCIGARRNGISRAHLRLRQIEARHRGADARIRRPRRARCGGAALHARVWTGPDD